MALNAGFTDLRVDQRGAARPIPFDVPADIGAFEVASDPRNPLVVTTTADTVANDGFISLREAIPFANSDTESGGLSTIRFDPTVFAGRETITLTPGSPLPPVTGEVAIEGPPAGIVVAGRVGPSNALFSVAPEGYALVQRMTFSGSKTGVRNYGSFFFIDGGFTSSTTNLDNTSTGFARLRNCSVDRASTGIQNNGELLMDFSTLHGNTTGLINVSGATAEVRFSTLNGSTTSVLNSGTFTMRSCTLVGNSEGVRSQSGSTAINQSTLVSNGSAVLGTNGAILTVNRCTISGNNIGVNTGGASTTLRNTLLVGNTLNLSGTATRAFNLLNASAAQAGLETDGSGRALLKDNGGPTLTVALVAGSPVINLADPGISQGEDQRGAGFPRAVGGRADIGAFEFQTPSIPQTLREAAPSAGSS
jgi:CSLREA domain-containing protein